MSFDQEYLIALGGNLPSEVGPPEVTLRAALDRLDAKGVVVRAVSSFFSTPCFPTGAGPDYVNAAARVGYHSNPPSLLEILHEVEAEFGRARVQRWGQRTLDLDLLAAGERVWPDAETFARWRGLPLDQQVRDAPGELVLPHPRLQDRAFVLVPLCDVASNWRHPVFGLTVAEMLNALPPQEVAQVVAIP